MKRTLKTIKEILKDIFLNGIAYNIYLILCLIIGVISIYKILDLIFIF